MTILNYSLSLTTKDLAEKRGKRYISKKKKKEIYLQILFLCSFRHQKGRSKKLKKKKKRGFLESGEIQGKHDIRMG